MEEYQHMINDQFRRVTSTIPPHILAPMLIILLTAFAASTLLYKSAEQDTYEPTEKPIIKVEEVRIPPQHQCN